jgi:hypothetical protein
MKAEIEHLSSFGVCARARARAWISTRALHAHSTVKVGIFFDGDAVCAMDAYVEVGLASPYAYIV